MDKKKIEEIARVSKTEKWPYPKTFQALKQAGVHSYEVQTSSHKIIHSDGSTTFQEEIPPGFEPLTIAKSYNVDAIKQALKRIQSKEIEYEEWLKLMAQGGCSSYRVSMASNTVTYFGALPGEEHVEIVPGNAM